jgi:hypothetical protein
MSVRCGRSKTFADKCGANNQPPLSVKKRRSCQQDAGVPVFGTFYRGITDNLTFFFPF